jgi:phosphoenolpyruvate carboxylase
VDVLLADLERKLYNNLFVPGQITDITQKEILKTLEEIRDILIYKHNSLFLHLVNTLKNKVQIFGLHFASLDIRQEASVHGTVIESLIGKVTAIPGNYLSLNEDEKINILSNLQPIDPSLLTGDEIQKDTIESVQVVKQIQKYNGEQGCNRYIISQCNSALNAMEVYGLFLLGGWKKEELNVDIVPLFETIDDLKGAASIMKKLYNNSEYQQHLKRRNNNQVIMVGFSDGTKDGGYLMANWSIYKAKEELTAISKECGIDVVFFDGRGGPPARGGGKTHKFYASLGKNISSKEIQLTIQGQTVSSNFGTIDSAQFNLEQLIHAGISNGIFTTKETGRDESKENIAQQLADISFDSYNQLKNHPDFVDYLVHASPLRFYSETNIGSRPAKRGASSKFSLKSLRAIPFVGAWSQLKQNVPGYFGVGTALQKLEQQGKLPAIKKLYNESLFFKTCSIIVRWQCINRSSP